MECLFGVATKMFTQFWNSCMNSNNNNNNNKNQPFLPKMVLYFTQNYYFHPIFGRHSTPPPLHMPYVDMLDYPVFHGGGGGGGGR